MMKGLFQKNLIHPTLQNENSEETEGLESQKKHSQDVVPILIPIRNEIESFERRLNNNELYSQEGGWSDLIIRRHYRNSDVPSQQNETCKYEVLNSFGSLMYQITEKTEFFVKETGCCFAPHCKEFIMNSTFVGVGSDAAGIKLIVEVGRTGFCNKITAIHHKRRLGSVSRKCSVIPNSYKYSVKNSHNLEIASLNSKHCFKSNVLCLRECQKFDIFMGKKDRFPKGKVFRESNGFGMTLFHGDESVTKILLIVSLVLMDLQINSRGRGLWQCDFISCFLQLMASICFYFMVLALIVLVFFTFVIP